MSEFQDNDAQNMDAQGDIDAMLDLSKKKKKKAKKVSVESMDAENNANTSGNSSENTPPTYTYSHMLNRIVQLLQQNNPELAEKRRNTLKPPQLMRVGTKKTLWVNFQVNIFIMKHSIIK